MRRSDPEPPLREQLLQARAAIARQLEVLRNPLGFRGAPDSDEIIAVLEQELRDIEDALAAEAQGDG